ncbi:DUF4286 family protein [Flavihumibacter petaseus]|uniref:DUF4286 domain-containing protein n=1 Tax=Flavihumibacter petaseus NBRC 106054 TaxID=1220578 RepID=A0A0E9MWL9_9BACT|nr:DUF4286 family protein [Flavihumibacter petaseus]GAO41974.1 hypothetical protein FPE01S_01_09870 [Flavihumibacter petaseus NBRC 106054]
MILYNITIKVEHSIAQDWQKWMLSNHMPQVLATGCFNSSRLYQLLEVDDSDGLTFSVQYTAPTEELYNRYITEFADSMRKITLDTWGNRYIAFRSAMRLVQ